MSTSLKHSSCYRKSVSHLIGGSIPRDLAERAANSLTQIVYHLRETNMTQGPLHVEVTHPKNDVVVHLSYPGDVITFPLTGISQEYVLEEEAFTRGLASFLTGVLPDRMEQYQTDSITHLKLHFLQ